jgi:hypothetical protein
VLRRPLVPALQWALLIATALVIAGAWRLALATG